MKYFSMFSGIGGFELGIQQAMPNARCVGFSEIDKWAVSIYKKHFKEHKNYGDANKINPSEIPDFDVLVGGFPCQAFSIAGKRQGFDDTRGTLFFEIARILKAKRPRCCVLENVKGLLSHDGGATFKTIISSLNELGYDTQWQVLNSKDFGVPQNRERVFIVGHLRACGKSAPEVFPFPSSNRQAVGLSDDKAHTITRYTATAAGTYIGEQVKINCLGNINPSGKGMNGNVFGDNGVCPSLTTNKGEGLKIVQLNQTNLKSNSGTQPYYQDRVYDPFGIAPALNKFVEPKVAVNQIIQLVGGSQGNRVYDPKGIAVAQQALSGGMGAKTGLYAIPVLTPGRAKKRQNGRRFKENGEPSFTLTSQDRHGVLIGKRIRRLMPIECERLQGFPDNWTKYGADGEEISDSQRYKCCGNAVTVNVVKHIVQKLNINSIQTHSEA